MTTNFRRLAIPPIAAALLLTGGVIGRLTAPERATELPLAIWHKGQAIPAGYGEYASPNITATRDYAITLRDGRFTVRPLARIAEPCGDPEPLDPSPGNVFVGCRVWFRGDTYGSYLKGDFIGDRQ